jgi:hypothetical protein
VVQAFHEPTEPATAEAADAATARDSGIGRKIAVGAAGSVVTAAGIVMLVTPGPGIVVTLAGLGILGSEFPAARRALDKIRGRDRRQSS